jgi:hypothetical protein
VLEHCVARCGLIDGARLAEFVSMWAIASNDLGREINVDELVEWWGKGISRRNAFYRLAAFREAFRELGEHATPQVFANALRTVERDARKVAMQPLDVVAA